jgi:hypothetical protein
MELIEGEYWSYIFTNDIPPGKTPRDVVNELAEQPGVRFVAQYEGGFKVFCAVTHPNLQVLQERVNDFYWGAGLHTDTFTLVTSGLAVPKRHSPEFSAIVLARADGDAGTVLGNIDAFFESRAAEDPDHVHFSYGAAVVEGPRFDLLVDLGTDDEDELVRTVREDLLRIEGVGRTTNRARAFLPGNAKRPGGQSA